MPDCPPDFQQTFEVWLVEAPLDALSLMQAGLNSFACISASLLDLLADTRTTLVITEESIPPLRKAPTGTSFFLCCKVFADTSSLMQKSSMGHVFLWICLIKTLN